LRIGGAIFCICAGFSAVFRPDLKKSFVRIALMCMLFVFHSCFFSKKNFGGTEKGCIFAPAFDGETQP
jgi:hypothetical protein